MGNLAEDVPRIPMSPQTQCTHAISTDTSIDIDNDEAGEYSPHGSASSYADQEGAVGCRCIGKFQSELLHEVNFLCETFSQSYRT